MRKTKRKTKRKPRKSVERRIQQALYYYTLGQNKKLWAHNIYLFNWESDFLSIDKNGLIYEYEIKNTLTDFRADFKKRKHVVFAKTVGDTTSPLIPNYFYFVCPVGVIDPKQVPTYAGLIYVKENGDCKVVKRARKLHETSRGYSPQILSTIAKSLAHRWYSK